MLKREGDITVVNSPKMVEVLSLHPSRAKGGFQWSWAEEDANTRTRQCLCCGRPGHYQEMLENYMASAASLNDFGILVVDGFVEDGHHRCVAAIQLGISHLPVETNENCRARWVRDHGHVDWKERKFGDR